MNETLEAIRAEWRGGGLERCLAGQDHGPTYAFDSRGKLREWHARFTVLVTMRDVERAVSQVTGVGTEMLHSPRRSKISTRPRQLAMYLMREFCLARSLPEIGRFFGRDHTTVMHAAERAKELLDQDPEFFAAHARARHILMGMRA